MSSVPSQIVAAALALATGVAAVAQPEPPAPGRDAPIGASDGALVEAMRPFVAGPVVVTARAALPGGDAAVAVAFRPPARPTLVVVVGVVAVGAGGRLEVRGHDDFEAPGGPGELQLSVSTERLAVAPGAFAVEARLKRADGGEDELTALFRLAGRVSRLLLLPAVHRSGADDPSPSVTREVALLPTATGGHRDLRVTTRTRSCPREGDCAEQAEVVAWVHDGLRYAARPYAVPSLERIAASSTLVARGQLANHSATSAVDGRLDTSWCEGAKGAGWFEKLELTLSPAQRVTAVAVVPGRGSGDAFREATRPRKLRVLLPDGRKAEATLEDAPTRQRIPIPPGERVFGLTVQIVDVVPGKRDEACIAELDLEVEP